MPLSMSLFGLGKTLFGLGMGTMLANFHMCDMMLVLRADFNMLVRNASPRGHMCFRCLIYCLSFYCFLDLSCGELMLYPCILCVALFVLCVACL